MNEEKEIIEMYNSLENKRSMVNILRAEKYTRLVDFLNKRFPMLSNPKYSVGMKVYWLVNGIVDFPPCSECGKPNKTHRCHIDGYATTVCSRKCANGEHKKSAMRKTFLERYGVENPLQNEDIKNRQRASMMERYGVDNISKLKDTMDLISKTKLQRYGDAHYVNREKAKATNILRYGSENPFGNQDIQSKARRTMVERYGVESPMKIDSIRKSVSEKTARHMIHISYENYLMANPFSEPAFDEEYYMRHRGMHKKEFKFKCRTCGKMFSSRIHNGRIRRCPKCWPSVTTSIKEQELFEFLSSIYSGEIIRKERGVLSGMELDIYIPDVKIAVEFDGLYWHSELNMPDKRYHLNKTEMCAQKGIRLIHVFEDEWDVKRKIVESRLKNALGIRDVVIYARKCDVVKIVSREEYEFLEKNHIQGKTPSHVCYGLKYKGELVCLMSFSKRRAALGAKSVNGEYELLRFCSKLGYSVVGGAGRLIKRFESEYHPFKLVSYADRRWSEGNLYEKLGFTLDHISPPNYWYLGNGCEVREHRFKYRKNVLYKKLKLFDPSLSEYENMKRNKYTRIWDCGNLVFMKTY